MSQQNIESPFVVVCMYCVLTGDANGGFTGSECAFFFLSAPVFCPHMSFNECALFLCSSACSEVFFRFFHFSTQML